MEDKIIFILIYKQVKKDILLGTTLHLLDRLDGTAENEST